MLFRIASLLGMTVERLLTEMGADEFLEWCAFYDLEPWGFGPDRINAGIVAAEVSNWSGRTRKKPDAKASDWLPRAGRKRRMTTEQMRARVKADIEKAKRNG